MGASAARVSGVFSMRRVPIVRSVSGQEAVGLPELHFHCLRHTRNTMAAAQGASLRELMEPMGADPKRSGSQHARGTRPLNAHLRSPDKTSESLP
jgi:integrase